MNDAEWAHIRHFDESEKWGDPAMMSFSLVAELDSLRDYVGQPIVIHRGYDAAARRSQHSHGLAADLHIVGMPLVEAFLAASRFSFMGIGVYPWWHNPGLHLDMRVFSV